MNTLEVRRFMHGCLSGVYRPTPTETIWDWAERCLKMPRGGENDEMAGKPWSSDYSPYLREVMEWFRTPGKCQLYISKSSQVGVTMACLIVICWHIVHRPVNIGYFIDSKEEARKISKSRLQRWIKDNHLLETIGEESDDLSNMTYFLKGMVVYLMGTYASGAFRNKALGIGILDEWDAHPPVDGTTTGELLDGRLKRHRHSKKIGFCTPMVEEGQTWKGYLSGTQERFHVPCPHCGEMQPLDWKNVRFSGPEFEDLASTRDAQMVLDATYYECRSMAKCRIEHHQKFDMLKAGKWIATNPKATPRIRSMQISDLYSNFVSWGELALEWIAAQTNVEKLRAFVNQRLGEPFRLASGTLKESDVLSCREHYQAGHCPIVPVLIALLVDVQNTSMKWTLCAFSSAGDLYVINWGECATWDEVSELAYAKVHTPTGEMSVECGLIDEGDGNRTKEVREFTHLHEHLFPVKGRGRNQIGMKELVYPSTSTTYQPDDTLTYHVNDNVFKRELLFNRIGRFEEKAQKEAARKNRARPELAPDDVRRTAYGRARLVLPWIVSEDFVAELLSERLETRKDRFGFIKSEWKKTGTNDWLDCLKYALALWSIMEPDLRAIGRIAA
jgi:phage terminase large subunit GpA-like protein